MSKSSLIVLAVFFTLSAWPASGQSVPNRPYINALPSGFLDNFDGWAKYEWRPKNSTCVPSCGYGRTIQVTYECWAATNGGDELHVVDNWCITAVGPRPALFDIPCGLKPDQDCDCPEGVPTLVFTHFAECVQPCGGKLERSAKCINYDFFCEQEGSDQAITNCARIIDTEEDCGQDLVATCSTYGWVGTGKITRNATCGVVEKREVMACQVLIFLRRGQNTFLVPDVECLAFGRLTLQSKEEASVSYSTEMCNYVPSEWTECDAACGTGTRTRTRKCMQRGRREVPEENCQDYSGIVDVPTSESCSITCEYRPREWSACSATCGDGTRQRERRCVQIINGIETGVDFDECAKDPSVVVQPRVETESCRIRDCVCEEPYYSAEDFGPCSATCEGTQTRTIRCDCRVEGVIRQENMSVCQALTTGPFPATERPCNDIPCPTYHYRMGSWGDCDSTCGAGQRRRPVQCIKTQGAVVTVVPLQECIDNGAGQPPTDVESCNSRCRYQVFPYQECSVTCGGGIQTRLVFCIRTTDTGSERVTLAECANDPTNTEALPETEQACNEQECPCLNPRWQPSVWSDCSLTCGNGTRTRTVECRCFISGRDTVAPDEKCEGQRRPHLRENCYTRCPCVDPQYVALPFGPCDKTCGSDAFRKRDLECHCQRGEEEAVEDIELCDNRIPEQKPVVVEPCELGDCPCTNDTIRYLYTRWGDCDRECEGTRRRKVQCRCEKENVDKWVDDEICVRYLGQAPVISEKCEPPCVAEWRTVTSWTACSKSCGQGTKTRVVVCEVFANGRLVDRGNDSQCIGADKPIESMECTGAVPEDKAVWITSGWTTCSNTCGVGVKHRQVKCVDKCTGRARGDRRCLASTKPYHKQGCNLVPCEYDNCVDKRDGLNCDMVVRLNMCEDIKHHRDCCQSCRHVLLGKR